MSRILIFGNSGSGKSTLARHLSGKEGLAHLDLDALAWLPESPPRRMPIAESEARIRSFLNDHDRWVIEGCYTDLLELVAGVASEVIFMNPGVEQCIANARSRPWEPHKYETREAQDSNLDMLLGWIKEYECRSDTFSYESHRRFYDAFPGKKCVYTKNEVHT